MPNEAHLLLGLNCLTQETGLPTNMSALCPDIAFEIPRYLTEPRDVGAWRLTCHRMEPLATKRLLLMRTLPIDLGNEADIETFHAMIFRGGSSRGRIHGWTGHIVLSIGHVPPTHLLLVLDIFEHAQSMTQLSVKDFDTPLCSFIVPTAPAATEGNITEADSLQRPLSDNSARRLLSY